MCGFWMPAYKHRSLASSGHTEFSRLKVSKYTPKRVDRLEVAIGPEGWKHLTAPLMLSSHGEWGWVLFSLQFWGGETNFTSS